ncbi:MAG TPA: DinB family protein [Gemmatimonadales bacterium]|nr:DinB family protein [Gemmatimonadales bacterium]
MAQSGVVPAGIAAILDRDLRALRREVEAYPDDRSLWQGVPGIINTGGTLVLHLTGNLQHYLGALFAGTGYVRDRPAEFARRDVPRAELLREIDAARSAVRAGLGRLSEAQLAADFPEAIAGARVATSDYLVHLTTHFAYHLGQLDYHRRVVTRNESGVGAVRPAELSSARPLEAGA